jgi:(2S)-methylsuccinyl-CoA dehydrogenase
LGETESLTVGIAGAEYAAQIIGGIPMNQGEMVRPADLGLTDADIAAFRTSEVEALMATGNTPEAARGWFS